MKTNKPKPISPKEKDGTHIDNDDALSTNSTDIDVSDNDLSDNDGDWLDTKQEKAITKVLLANAKRKSPNDISQLGTKLAKVNRFIQPKPETTITKPKHQTKVILRDLEVARLKNRRLDEDEEEEGTKLRDLQTSKDEEDTSSALKILKDLDDQITDSYAFTEESERSNHIDKPNENQIGENSQPQSETASSWNKYFKEVETRRGLSKEEKFLKTYFTKEMWKGNSDPKVTVKDVDLSINDAVDEAEIVKSDHFEAEHNFRYERGSTRTQIIGHARLDDAFKPLKKLGKRARQRLNKKERKAAELEAKKQDLLVNSGPNVPIDQLGGSSDEDFPSDQEWFLCDSCNTPIEGGKARYDCIEDDCDFCLCKNCQKKVKHEHALRRVKTHLECNPPKSWPLALAAKKNIDIADQITQNVLKGVKYDIDDGFKYIDCPPLDFGLSEEDLFSIEESKLNALAPPTCLEPYEDPAKLNYLCEKGLRRVREFKKKRSANELEPQPALSQSVSTALSAI